MPGHAREGFSLSQVTPEAARAWVSAGLLKARVRACHWRVALAGIPLPAAPPAASRLRSGQTGFTAQPGAAPARGAGRCAEPNPEIFTAGCLDLRTPGDFYPEVSWHC